MHMERFDLRSHAELFLFTGFFTLDSRMFAFNNLASRNVCEIRKLCWDEILSFAEKVNCNQLVT